MVQSPSWEANWFAASQEIPRISRNPNVHYRTHKRPPTVSILGQPNPVHIPTSLLLEIHPNIIHPSTPRSSQCSPSLRSKSSLTQEIPQILYKPLVIYRVFKDQSLVLVLTHTCAIHVVTSYLFRINFNIILHLCLGLRSGSFPWGEPPAFLYVTLCCPTCATCPTLLSLPDYAIVIMFEWDVKIMQLLITQFYPVPKTLSHPSHDRTVFFYCFLFGIKLPVAVPCDLRCAAAWLLRSWVPVQLRDWIFFIVHFFVLCR